MELTKDNLLNGTTIPVLVKGITLASGTYKRGTALGLKDGVHKIIGETGYDAATFNCILTEDKTLESDGVAEGYFTGEFRLSEVKVKADSTTDGLPEVGRKLNIFLG